MQTPETPAAKLNEINFIENLTKVRGAPPSEIEAYLLGKPFNDARRGYYVMDLGQIMKLLPDPPARKRHGVQPTKAINASWILGSPPVLPAK